MKITPTPISGLHIIEGFHATDHRGSFTKMLHQSTLNKYGLEGQFAESFFSVNKAGVIRGMHFQKPPDDHEKLVYCNAGRLIDVVIDLRKSSPTFQHVYSLELSALNHRGLYIPKGLAHGFETLEDQTMMTYLTSTEHSPAYDAGILYRSIDHEWQTSEPLLSERDKRFIPINEFETPFD